jgi:hypothetical protein
MAEATTTPWTPVIEPVTLPDGYVIRELAPEEWHRLPEAGSALTHLSPDAVARVVAVLSPDDRLVGHVLLTLNPMAEHLHLAPEVQHHAKLGLAFVGAFVTLLRREQVEQLYAMSAEDDPEAQTRLERLGFQTLPVKVHLGRFPTEGA